ncbi:hypothetical protein IE4803_CH02771 [Rhizobium etli bv. phaseoli str. IE4803]|nr:hypothetical protein IE4803_CH02771 [Rhizobium etli bv. phaseoli str. IE4803]
MRACVSANMSKTCSVMLSKEDGKKHLPQPLLQNDRVGVFFDINPNAIHMFSQRNVLAGTTPLCFSGADGTA